MMHRIRPFLLSLRLIPSTRDGCHSFPGGVTFRVWSMFADSASVVGDFNNWSTVATPMARDGASNYWSVDVPGAAVGQAYKFFLPYASKAGRATAGSPGTFDTAMVRLPELSRLGVNAIEIMPLGRFTGSASTGYNPGYIFAVEERIWWS
jgi:1,4-alpha-glucan branching enzyme